MRDPEIKLLADKLEKHFNDRDRRSISKTESKNQKSRVKSNRSRNFKAANSKY